MKTAMSEDFITLLEDDEPTLPPARDISAYHGTPAAGLQELPPEADWKDDPVPVKLEKIRAAFLNGKSASEVLVAASMMPIGDWIELVTKLAPKNIQVQGEFSFKHMLEEFGPVDKEQYRFRQLPSAAPIEVEYEEVK